MLCMYICILFFFVWTLKKRPKQKNKKSRKPQLTHWVYNQIILWYEVGMTDPQLHFWDFRYWRIQEYEWKPSKTLKIQLLMIRPHSSLKFFVFSFPLIPAVESCWKVKKEIHQYSSGRLQDRFLCLFLIVTLEWMVTLQEHRWIYLNSLPWLTENNGREQQSKNSPTEDEILNIACKSAK